MRYPDGDTRAARRLGIGFAILFTAASTALLGDLVGAFARARSGIHAAPPRGSTYDQTMRYPDGDTRAARRLGIGFAILFTAASTALLGDLVGAFADSASSFAYFDSSAERLRHAAGA